MVGVHAAGRHRSANGRWARYGPPVLISAVYLPLALCYSLMTRAWEANDELDHATYVEYIVRHGSLPLISAANGHESHQPPLYYLLAAGWQKLLDIPAFTPSATPNPRLDAQAAVTDRFLELLHNYTPVQHHDAIYLHELRLLSVLLGLATVLLSYGCARLVFARKPAAVAAALTVALVPKQLVVDSAVTNDSLVITLCAAGLYLFLLSERARRHGGRSQRRWLMLGLGMTLGLAAITKYTSGPLIVLLVVLTALPAWRRRRRLVIDTGIALAGLAATSLWWFIRDKVVYGQFLATKATMTYLRAWLPPLIVPVSWTNLNRFFVFVPSNLYRSTWYDGGWNQYVLPKWLNMAVWALAAVSVISAALALWGRRPGGRPWAGAGPLAIAGVVGSIFAGIAAVVIIAQTTTQAEGRVAFAGLVGFALLLVMGLDFGRNTPVWARVAVFGWPVVLLALNGYVFYEYLVPLRGL